MAKITYKGKRYNTGNCIVLGNHDLYSYSNNYAGTRSLLAAKDGAYLIHQCSNGQDLHISNDICVISKDEAIVELDNMSMTDEQEAAAIKAGLIEIVG